MGAWKWMGVSVPFILFILHVLIQQDTRPFKEQIKRTAYVTTVAEPQTKMQLLGCFGHSSRYITEDAEGNRYDNKAVVDEDKIDCTGLISIDQHHAGYYIAPGSVEKLANYFNGKSLTEIINKYGDYVSCDLKTGLYKFIQIIPIIDGKRYEEGVSIYFSKGIAIKTALLGPEYTTSNMFLNLPFAENILALNLGRAHFGGPYCEIIEAKEIDEEPKGFFGAVLSFLWTALWGLISFVVGLVLIAVIVFLLSATCGLVSMPLSYLLSYHTNLSNGKIIMLSGIISVPLIYIFSISLADSLHSLWLVVLPMSIIFGIFALIQGASFSIEGRCPKCHSIGTEKYTRFTYEYERSEQKWEKVSKDYVRTEKVGNTSNVYYHVKEQLVETKIYRETGETECMHCHLKTPITKHPCESKVIDTRMRPVIETRTESPKKKDEIVYITDSKGHRIRCRKSPYSDVKLYSDEDPDRSFSKDVVGNWTED